MTRTITLEGGPRDGQELPFEGGCRYEFPVITMEDRLVNEVYDLDIRDGVLFGVYRGQRDEGSWSEISWSVTRENIRYLFRDCS